MIFRCLYISNEKSLLLTAHLSGIMITEGNVVDTQASTGYLFNTDIQSEMPKKHIDTPKASVIRIIAAGFCLWLTGAENLS